MAYVVSSEFNISPDNIDTLTLSMPDYSVGDGVFILISQDNGSYIDTTTSGWVKPIALTKTSGIISGWHYKIMTALNDPDVVFTFSTSNDVAYSILVIRDLDTTTPIQLISRDNFNNTGTPSTTSITTTSDKCLMLHSLAVDGVSVPLMKDTSQLINTSKVRSTGHSHVSGYTYQESAGATPIIDYIIEVATEGGQMFTLAINNSVGGETSPYTTNTFEIIDKIGTSSKTWFAPPAHLSTVMGTTVDNIYLPAISTSIDGIDDWAEYAKITNKTSTADDVWIGAGFNFDTTLDLSFGSISLAWYIWGKFRYIGDNAFAFVLSDSNNNWQAYQLVERKNLITERSHVSHITINSSNATDESTTALDLTDIVSITFLAHKLGANTTSLLFQVKNLLRKTTEIIVGGSVGKPMTSIDVGNSLTGWGHIEQSFVQGVGQAISTSGIQLGDGILRTYVDFSTSSYETSTVGLYNKIDPYTQDFIIYASPTDVMLLTSCIISTQSNQNFIIHNNSSTSATYSFKNSSIIGWSINWKNGITCDGATLHKCDVKQNGALFDSCVFTSTIVECSNLSNITNSSASTDSSFDLTASGTFSLTNTKLGSLTNSSGGNIIINLVGDSSVSNNIGPNITIISGQVSTKILVVDIQTGAPLVNARVYVEASSGGDIAAGTILQNTLTDTNGVVEFYESYTSNQPIVGRVRFSSSSPYYKTASFFGEIDKVNGFITNIQMVRDE